MLSLKHWGLSIFSGLLLSLAWPANGIPFLALFALVPLLYIEDELSRSRFKGIKFFGYCYATFVIWNFLTTYWIYYSSPEGAYVAILLNSFIMAMVWWLFHRTKNALGAKRGYIGLIAYWIAYEYLHLDWDLSWPWLMLGNVFANRIEFVQWYEYTGAMGGSIWILVSNIVLLYLFKEVLNSKAKRRTYVFVAAWLFVPMLFSLVRYFTYREKHDPISVVLVQPNIDPWKKFNGITPTEQMQGMLRLAAPLTDQQTDYVILPETAIPVGIWHDQIETNPLIDSIQAFIAPYPTLKFITGMSHLQKFAAWEKIPSTASPLRNGEYYDDHNSAIQICNSLPFQLYHKSKLVPGPEMFPFAEYLKPFQHTLFGKLGGEIGNFGTQKERSVFYNDHKEIYAAPVICYESIYGEFVGDYMLKGGNFISVSTNDAWWGNSPGYRQLLAYTRLRAVETRRSVARSANTGISCFINQRGDVIAPTKFMEATAIKGTINVNHKLTFYTRYGDYLGRTSLLLGLMMLLYAFVRGFLRRRNSIVQL